MIHMRLEKHMRPENQTSGYISSDKDFVLTYLDIGLGVYVAKRSSIVITGNDIQVENKMRRDGKPICYISWTSEQETRQRMRVNDYVKVKQMNKEEAQQ